MIKGLATWNYFLWAQLPQMDREYCATLQTSILSITSVQTLMYTHKLCVKFSLKQAFWLLGLGISKSGNFCWTDHLGRFPPREINSLYGTYMVQKPYHIMNMVVLYTYMHTVYMYHTHNYSMDKCKVQNRYTDGTSVSCSNTF